MFSIDIKDSFCYSISSRKVIHQNSAKEAPAFRRGEESAQSVVSFIGKISSLKFLLPLDLHHILYYNLEKKSGEIIWFEL